MHYRVIITDELLADSPAEAAAETMRRLNDEETVAEVTNLATGGVTYVRCNAGLSPDDLSH